MAVKTHSTTRFQSLDFFFHGGEKKNTVFLLTHSILSKIATKVYFTREKKYGTFGSPNFLLNMY